MKQGATSVGWYESAPDPLDDDLGLGVLVVRLGLAANALNASLRAARDASSHPAAVKTPDVINAMVMSASLTHEAVELARSEMPLLRELSKRGGASDDVRKRMGKLCGGKHPASAFVARIRNGLGFHWVKEQLEPSVESFRRNQKIVWIETDGSTPSVHSFAHVVLINALFPENDTLDDTQANKKMDTTLGNLSDAIDLVALFFSRSVLGYLRAYGISEHGRRRAAERKRARS
jgi:hypothetical protein